MAVYPALFNPIRSLPYRILTLQLRCRFGARCVNRNGVGRCSCDTICKLDDDASDWRISSVCGSDGKTYISECQLELFACK